MGRIAALLLLSAVLASCSAVAPLIAIPGYFVDEVVYQFKGAERSFALNLDRTLGAVQAGLREVRLDMDVVERNGQGYAILFGNAGMDGKMVLRRDTPALSTVYIQVHRGMTREDAIEQAILDAIEQHAHRGARLRFDRHGYETVHARPQRSAKTLGWFRPGARLSVRRAQTRGWLVLTLPSGNKGYIQASIGRSRS